MNHVELLSRVLSELNGSSSVNVQDQIFVRGNQQNIAVIIGPAIPWVQIAVIYFNKLLPAKQVPLDFIHHFCNRSSMVLGWRPMGESQTNIAG